MDLFGKIFSALKSLASGLVSNALNSTNVITAVMSQIPHMVEVVGSYRGADSGERIDIALEEFDHHTGIEGVTVIRNMPAEVEEQTLDALKIVIGNLLKNKAKIRGYYEVNLEDQSNAASSDAMSLNMTEVSDVNIETGGSVALREAVEVVKHNAGSTQLIGKRVADLETFAVELTSFLTANKL